MSTEDIKETDKEVIELLYSSEWPSVVGVGTLPSFKRFKVHGEREIWHSILYDVHVQMYKKKLSEFLTIFLELYLSLEYK